MIAMLHTILEKNYSLQLAAYMKGNTKQLCKFIRPHAGHVVKLSGKECALLSKAINFCKDSMLNKNKTDILKH